MNKIKFRCWDKVDEKWIDCEHLCTDSSGKLVTIIDNNTNHYSLESVELMQYTGLKDKNGKEIYEGDIVKYATDSLDKGNILKNYKISEVKNNSPYSFSPWWDNFVIEPEVIGNIYENKELIYNK